MARAAARSHQGCAVKLSADRKCPTITIAKAADVEAPFLKDRSDVSRIASRKG
jgi:hypothetical protein